MTKMTSTKSKKKIIKNNSEKKIKTQSVAIDFPRLEILKYDVL